MDEEPFCFDRHHAAHTTRFDLTAERYSPSRASVPASSEIAPYPVPLDVRHGIPCSMPALECTAR